ncbi:MAG: hypothetical protein AVDCRST_MAG56-385 [uncultured Cytophagales bacterium]|uniref:Uncharacterized protein n=1 Tax=uncultured Cytophagales bacterium TaxID=158755 RepID=A0A6J4HEA9_9SPHI|nr:MAG: hypothetical protein AVDCRST_MAG56-385 [uncultured Cytophagales bacterium]
MGFPRCALCASLRSLRETRLCVKPFFREEPGATGKFASF